MDKQTFSRNKKFENCDSGGSFIGTWTFGVHHNWEIQECFREETQLLYYTIDGVDEEFEELSDAIEVLYNLYLEDQQSTEGYY